MLFRLLVRAIANVLAPQVDLLPRWAPPSPRALEEVVVHRFDIKKRVLSMLPPF
jgi:hypothetical protein